MIWLCGLADLDMAFQFLKEIWIWVEEPGDLKLLRCLTMKEVEIDKTSYLLNQRIPLHRRSVYICPMRSDHFGVAHEHSEFHMVFSMVRINLDGIRTYCG
jgi:hypothetical protein